jgi:hypothetical protein
LYIIDPFFFGEFVLIICVGTDMEDGTALYYNRISGVSGAGRIDVALDGLILATWTWEGEWKEGIVSHCQYKSYTTRLWSSYSAVVQQVKSCVSA